MSACLSVCLYVSACLSACLPVCISLPLCMSVSVYPPTAGHRGQTPHISNTYRSHPEACGADQIGTQNESMGPRMPICVGASGNLPGDMHTDPNSGALNPTGMYGTRTQPTSKTTKIHKNIVNIEKTEKHQTTSNNLIQQPKHQISHSHNRQISQSTNQPITQSTNHPTHQSTYQPINQAYHQPINQSSNQPINQSTNQPINQPTNQPMHQPTNKSQISQPPNSKTNQSTNQPTIQ